MLVIKYIVIGPLFCDQLLINLTRSRKGQHQRLQLLEIWRSQPRHWIPTNRCIPARKWDNTGTGDGYTSLSIDPITANASAACDVVES